MLMSNFVGVLVGVILRFDWAGSRVILLEWLLSQDIKAIINTSARPVRGSRQMFMLYPNLSKGLSQYSNAPEF